MDKSSQLAIKIRPDIRELLEKAAARRGVTLTGFIMNAATEKADQVLSADKVVLANFSPEEAHALAAFANGIRKKENSN